MVGTSKGLHSQTQILEGWSITVGTVIHQDDLQVYSALVLKVLNASQGQSRLTKVNYNHPQGRNSINHHFLKMLIRAF
jgi:hypothetical protein